VTSVVSGFSRTSAIHCGAVRQRGDPQPRAISPGRLGLRFAAWKTDSPRPPDGVGVGSGTPRSGTASVGRPGARCVIGESTPTPLATAASQFSVFAVTPLRVAPSRPDETARRCESSRCSASRGGARGGPAKAGHYSCNASRSAELFRWSATSDSRDTR
jgi:hypothetical protein